MATVCRIHLSLPNVDHVESQTTLAYIHDTLMEGFDLMDDHVNVRLEPNQNDHNPQSVSVIYDGKCGCQIYLNDNEAQVQTESEKWCTLYGTGLAHEERNNILACKRRLDVFCEPEVEHVCANQFDDLILYLRLIFDPSYVYDPIQKRFVLD